MKNINKNFILTLLSLLAFTNIQANPTGKELFIQKCTSCHSINMPKSQKDLHAPPAVGVMFHLNNHFDNNEDLIAHIESFTMNPTREKAICKSIRRFGIMPSQKGKLTKEELSLIAQWLANDVFITRSKYKRDKKAMFDN
ncbi:c-type cytochrome [Sulfurimonas sp. SAG-AH-194-I05]|nr:c-type cytochrome [Sulfurimonas sp. SAG-AH-194-I05]MDF1875715.1 c-type cytochrome [Sulfurimonas sp. SAG-AH-194-I05]